RFALDVAGRIVFCLAIMVFAHVLYHRPWSPAGVWAVTLGATLAAWTPQRTRQPDNPVTRVCAALLLFVPAWLAYFSQVRELKGILAAWDAWPILATAMALFLTGLFARIFPQRLAATYHHLPRSRFRLFDATLSWLESDSVDETFHRVTLLGTL